MQKENGYKFCNSSFCGNRKFITYKYLREVPCILSVCQLVKYITKQIFPIKICIKILCEINIFWIWVVCKRKRFYFHLFWMVIDVYCISLFRKDLENGLKEIHLTIFCLWIFQSEKIISHIYCWHNTIKRWAIIFLDLYLNNGFLFIWKIIQTFTNVHFIDETKIQKLIGSRARKIWTFFYNKSDVSA